MGTGFDDVSLSKEQVEAMRRELSPTTRTPLVEHLTLSRGGKRLPTEEARKFLKGYGGYVPPSSLPRPANLAIFHRGRSGGTLRGQIAAHELGHARLHTKPVLGRLLRGGYVAKNPLTGLGLVIAARAPEDSVIGDAAQYGGVLGVAPQLADEAYASVRGYGALRKHVADAAVRKAAKGNLLRAFGTYGAAAAPLAAAPFLARKFKKRLLEKRRGKRTPGLLEKS